MSRWSKQWALGAATLAIGIGLSAPLASASPEPPVSEPPVSGSPASGSPASGQIAPVLDIDAPVVDIVLSTADLERAVRVDQDRTSIRVTLDATVLFGKDSAAIRPGAADRLSAVADSLERRGPGPVRIVGYTDDLGSAAHGLELSRRRARAVATVLRRQLPSGSYPFTVTGRGEADPAVPNTSEANRRINRRVVIDYRADRTR